MNWTDRLAARTGQAVELAVVGGPPGCLELAQHVFRPDDSAQRLRTGEHQPLHATALGLVLLAGSPAAPAPRTLTLAPYTATTVRDTVGLEAQLDDVRRVGHAVEVGTHRPHAAAVAVPVRGAGHGAGWSAVAALGVVGRPEHLLDAAHRPLAGLLVHLQEAARAVGDALADDP
jgi:DNA-binding IclR family transcriptional regulator